jgi:hypothetical protein
VYDARMVLPLALMLSRSARRPIGVFRGIERDSHDELVALRIAVAKGKSDLVGLSDAANTWTICVMGLRPRTQQQLSSA